MNRSSGRRLRELLAGDSPVIAPGAYDCVSARLVQEAGFAAVHVSGSATAASVIGRPDLGLLTQTELVTHARHITAAVDLPVIVDADTGYGNALNVMRTIQELEAAGVAGCHLEDQVTPKRCGYLAGKELVSRDEFAGKLRAAIAARRNPGFVIIARTDAWTVEGPDEAVARARLAFEAGADLAFVPGPASPAEITALAAQAGGPLAAIALGGRQTEVVMPPADLRRLGFRLLFVPNALILAAIAGLRRTLASLRDAGRVPAGAHAIAPFDDLFRLLDLDAYQAAADCFAR